MTPLRERMIRDMRVRNFSSRTTSSYLWAVEGLARYYRKAPDQLNQGSGAFRVQGKNETPDSLVKSCYCSSSDGLTILRKPGLENGILGAVFRAPGHGRGILAAVFRGFPCLSCPSRRTTVCLTPSNINGYGILPLRRFASRAPKTAFSMPQKGP
jgi:hypothetical protein